MGKVCYTFAMQLVVKRVDKSLPFPKYQTEGAVAFDLYARVEMVVKPLEAVLIPLNLIVKVPAGYVFLLASRSSYPKKGLLIPNGVGIIDQDYSGEQDELKVWALNFTKENIVVEKGERIAQGLLVPLERVKEFVEVDSVVGPSRGGFGSTGKK